MRNKEAKKIISVLMMFVAALSVCACGKTEVIVDPLPTEELRIEEVREESVDISADAEKIRISEIMIKNRTTLRAEEGNFPDWIEIENCSSDNVFLGGWRISDKDNAEKGWQLPEIQLAAGERLIIYADGKDNANSLHADFSLSEGEGVYLYNSFGYLACAVEELSGQEDISLVLNSDGEYEETLYPTPGMPNETEYYEHWMCSRIVHGPLQINRVSVYNCSEELYGADWVEIKNISGESVQLSDFYLSDDEDDYRQWNFPQQILKPGKSIIVCCSDEIADRSLIIANFSLDSDNEQLYLSNSNGELIDYASLKNIPYDCSYGRMDGQDGWFYFYGSAPSDKVKKGYRRVSETPTAVEADGVFNGVANVSVSLQGKGKIYYTTDSSMPTEKSKLYSEEINVDKTSIIRAVCVEDGAMPSRALTLSYIINENHTLPVLSLVSDNSREFNEMYSIGRKDPEIPGSLALYEDGAGFTIPCGIKMHGETSLRLDKKNMSVRFRGAYGQEELNYDVYGGGVTTFNNFVIRAGQDYYHAIIRNELCQNLALAASDNVITQRSKYCVLYVDGQYRGIYNLMEKANEQHYANLAGVSRESVTLEEAVFPDYSPLYQEVFSFCYRNDMSLDENYRHFCSVMDVDSLIDWMILEGFCANPDLSSGNLRYCRSTENDGKWRFVFYDLDAAFHSPNDCFSNILFASSLNERTYGTLIARLLKNEEFVDRFLSRTAELLSTTLTNENVVAEIERLSAEIDAEVYRDYAKYGMHYSEWRRTVDGLKEFFTIWKWPRHNVNMLCEFLDLSNEQREHYFGELLEGQK